MGVPETIYLDHAATTPLAPEVRAAMAPYLDERFGNPSSRHPVGARAAEALDRARKQTAAAVGGRPGDVIFTAGGTEANNLAVLGFARARRRAGTHVIPHVLIGPTEHPSVRMAAFALRDEGFDVEEARLDEGGALDVDDLARRLRAETVVVAVMLVNNELGTIQPVARIAKLVRRAAPAAAMHVDAVQATGKLELSLPELGVDSLGVSAHKVHGPKGSGALVLAAGTAPPKPLLFGGGQERGLRGGTENVAGIVGLGQALELGAGLRAETCARTGAARARLVERLAALTGGLRVLAPGAERSPSILAVLLPGPPAEVWMHHLEARGVMTSAGSACHAKTDAISPGLVALGLDGEQAKRVLRFSFARTTTVPEIDAAADALERVAGELGAHAR
jgi:cysteine desulfurase